MVPAAPAHYSSHLHSWTRCDNCLGDRKNRCRAAHRPQRLGCRARRRDSGKPGDDHHPDHHKQAEPSHTRKHGGLVFLVLLLIAISPAFGFLFTAPQPGPGSDVPYVVTTGTAVAGMAYAATFFALYLWLLMRAIPRVARSPHVASVGTNRELLTALVGPCEAG